MSDINETKGITVSPPAGKVKEPIGNDVQWANQKQEIKEMFSNKNVREIAIKDFEYGLGKEDIMLYADKQHLPLENIVQLSRAIKIYGGRELVNYLRDCGLNAYQMEIIIDFYQKGVSLDKIREVMGHEQTAYSLSQALQKVYEALYKARENAAGGNDDVKKMQEKIEEVVSQVGANKEFLDQVLSKLEDISSGQDTDALSQSFIEKLEEKDIIIKAQQEENNKLATDNALLRSRQGQAQEEKLKDARTEFEQEKAELMEKVKRAESEKSMALARLDEAGKEREAMERKIESMEREMEAVKEQLEIEKKKDRSETDKTPKQASKRLVGNIHHALIEAPDGRQQIVEVERTSRRNPAGIMAMAGKLFKDKNRGRLLQTISEANLDSGRMDKVKLAIESGLSDDEVINIIQCGFDEEQMEKAIEIVILEKSYA